MSIEILRASEDDMAVVENMIRFYVYDMTEYLGWDCPETGLFGGCDVLPQYWGKQPKDPSRLTLGIGVLAPEGGRGM